MARHIPSRFGKCQADLASKTHTTTGNQSPRAHKSIVNKNEVVQRVTICTPWILANYRMTQGNRPFTP